MLDSMNTTLNNSKENRMCVLKKENKKTINIYIATNGNDSWSGTVPDPNDASTDGPFATLQRAREAVRGLRDAEGKLPGPVSVLVRGGKYYLNKTLILGSEDSGMQNCPVMWQAYPGETPVLYGGRQLTDWEPEGDCFWSAVAPGTASGDWDIRQLYVNGESRLPARLPETGSWRHGSIFAEPYDPCFDPLPSIEKRSTLVYEDGQLPTDFVMKNVEFVVLHSWDDSHTRAVAHDPATKTLLLHPACTYPPGFGSMEYYILNLREGMTKPGQWYLDRERERIIYWPLPGEEPNLCKIEAPFLTSLLCMEGNSRHVPKDNVPEQGSDIACLEGILPVTNITISGLTFDLSAAALYRRDSEVPDNSSYPGASDEQSVGVWSENLTGAVMLVHARNCRLTNVTIQRAGGQGIKIMNTDQTTVEYCDIAHVGANGIAFNFGTQNTIVSNRVRHVGELYNFAVGIHGINWSYGRIACNEVSECTYSGITLSNKDHIPAENVVEYNHVWNVMNALNDGGCIYFSWAQRGTVVRGNLLHGSRGRTAMANGLYLDIGVEGVTCERNMVYDIGHGALHVHMAKHNVIRDNIFLCGSHGYVSFQRSADILFERNIVYGTGSDIPVRFPEGARFVGNQYWTAAGAPHFRQVTIYDMQIFLCGFTQEAPGYLALDLVSDVDGSLTATDWERTKMITRLVNSGGEDALHSYRAETRFLRQGDWLHVWIRLERPYTNLSIPKNSVWDGDQIELFLKPCFEPWADSATDE